MATMATSQQQQHHQSPPPPPHPHSHPHHYNANQGSLPMLHTHSIQTMPHGLGLLTTVASLPPKYRSRYLKIQTKCEIPLDLSVRPMSPHNTDNIEVPMAVNFTEVYTEPSSDTHSQTSEDIVEEICTSLANNDTITTTTTTTDDDDIATNSTITIGSKLAQEHNKPITPPLTPIKRKFSESDLETEQEYKENYNKAVKIEKSMATNPKPVLLENTPSKQPIKSSDTAPKTAKNPLSNSGKSNRSSNKATRKLKFDEETSSPVSGTIIRPLEDITDGSMQYSNGDIDPKYNIVEITEETKAELAAIKNVIGDYICKLCRIKFDDAFGLAQHRCACIVLLEYRCPECGKQFNCPANLASHRRWHKPRKNATPGSGNINATGANSGAGENQSKKENRETKTAKKTDNGEGESLSFACQQCGKKFKRQAYLKKHELTHQKASIQVSSSTNVSIINNELTPASSRSNNSSPINRAGSPPMKAGGEQLQGQAPTQVQAHTQVQAPTPTPPTQTPLTSLPLYEEVVITETVLKRHNSYMDEDHEDTMSDYSSSTASSSHHYGRLQIVETGLTEEENIAAAALTNLRNCASVIQHTTLAH